MSANRQISWTQVISEIQNVRSAQLAFGSASPIDVHALGGTGGEGVKTCTLAKHNVPKSPCLHGQKPGTGIESVGSVQGTSQAEEEAQVKERTGKTRQNTSKGKTRSQGKSENEHDLLELPREGHQSAACNKKKSINAVASSEEQEIRAIFLYPLNCSQDAPGSSPQRITLVLGVG